MPAAEELVRHPEWHAAPTDLSAAAHFQADERTVRVDLQVKFNGLTANLTIFDVGGGAGTRFYLRIEALAAVRALDAMKR